MPRPLHRIPCEAAEQCFAAARQLHASTPWSLVHVHEHEPVLHTVFAALQLHSLQAFAYSTSPANAVELAPTAKASEPMVKQVKQAARRNDRDTITKPLWRGHGTETHSTRRSDDVHPNRYAGVVGIVCEKYRWNFEGFTGDGAHVQLCRSAWRDGRRKAGDAHARARRVVANDAHRPIGEVTEDERFGFRASARNL